MSTRFRMMSTERSRSVGRELVAARRLRLEHDLEAALEVEALAQRLVDRRAGNREQRDADERRDEQPDQEEVIAARRQS